MAKGKIQVEVDLNSADIDEIARLRGVGRKRAQALVDYREENGPFEDWDDLKNVEGFDGALIEDLQDSGAILGEVKEESEGEEEEW